MLAAAISASLAARARAGDPKTDVPPTSELERIYVEGQRLREEGEHEQAARTWAELLLLLPEEEEWKVIRENVVLNIIDASLEANRRYDPSSGVDQEVLLDFAAEILADYTAKYTEAYGEGAAVSAEIKEVEDKLQEARDSLVAQCLSPIVGPCLQPCLSPCLSQLPPPRGCGGESDNGLGMLGLLAVPVIARRRSDVLRAVADRLPADVAKKLGLHADDDD